MEPKIVTEEVREKISATKNASSLAKILGNAQDFELPQSDKQLAIPTHRYHKHISLEEYKELLASGKTVLQICAMTSKHLVYFYNALLDGRISLTKDDFVKLYESGLSLNEIADQNKISRGHMAFLREFYGIKRKGATFQKRLTTELPLSDEAKSILVGSILGDGHIHPLGYWSEKHCIAQADYLRWKASFVPDITTDKSFSEYEAYDKRYKKSYKGLSFRTRSHSYLYELGEMFYRTNEKSRVKFIPENIVELLDDLALAVWFMDDGNTDWGYRRRQKQWQGRRPTCCIHTESFQHIDLLKLCRIIQSKFGLACNPKKKGGNSKNWIIQFTSESSAELINRIKKYTPQCMKYKFYEDEYIKRFL